MIIPNVSATNNANINPKIVSYIEIIQNSGLNYEIGAMSTTVEGEFDEVFEIIKSKYFYYIYWCWKYVLWNIFNFNNNLPNYYYS